MPQITTPILSGGRSAAHLQYSAFTAFAKDADDLTIAARVRTQDGRLTAGVITPKSQTKSDFVGNVLRGKGSRGMNDDVRALFRESIVTMFGVANESELPAEVREAMKTDDFGKGKPLTARRIRAVQTAVDQQFAALAQPLESRLAAQGVPLDAETKKRVMTAVKACVGKPDALAFVTENIGSLLIDEYDLLGQRLCPPADFKAKIDDFVAMVDDLKAAALGDAALFALGKEFLAGQVRLHLKPDQFRGLLDAVRAAAQRPDVSAAITTLANAPTVTVQQLYDGARTLLEAADGTAADFRGILDLSTAPNKEAGARNFFLGLMLHAHGGASICARVRNTLDSAKAGQAKTLGRDLEAELRADPATAPEPIPGTPDFRTLPQGQRLYMADDLARGAMALDALKTAADICCGAPTGTTSVVQPMSLPFSTGGDYKAFRRSVDGVLKPAAARIMEERRQAFLSGAVNGDGAVADLMRFAFSRKIGRAPYQPDKMFADSCQDTVTRMLRQRIATDFRSFATEQGRAQFASAVRQANVYLPGHVALSGSFEEMRDQIAGLFLDEGARPPAGSRPFDALDAQRQNKVYVAMALIMQDTAKAAFRGPGLALNTDYNPRTDVLDEGRILPAFDIVGGEAVKPSLTLRFDAEDGLSVDFSCRRPVSQLKVLRPVDDSYAEIDLDGYPVSSIAVDYQFTINAQALDRMAAGGEVQVLDTDVSCSGFDLTATLNDPSGPKLPSVFPPPWTNLLPPGQTEDPFAFTRPLTLESVQRVEEHERNLEENPLDKKGGTQQPAGSLQGLRSVDMEGGKKKGIFASAKNGASAVFSKMRRHLPGGKQKDDVGATHTKP